MFVGTVLVSRGIVLKGYMRRPLAVWDNYYIFVGLEQQRYRKLDEYVRLSVRFGNVG